MSGLEVLLWGAVTLVGYAYLAYPLVLLLWSRCSHRPARLPEPEPAAPEQWPMVSLVIAAYKEEQFILQRVTNALLMDYPADRLEIIIGCDGQEDATGELVGTVDDPRVKLMQFPQRRGKPSVLNDCVRIARGEIIAFSDANTFWDRKALQRLVRHFRKPEIGGACGQLILTDAATGQNVDGMYWRYENFLKRREGELGALLGFNGAIYAIRKNLWQPIPPQTIVDDFLIGMRIYLRRMGVVFDEEALAHEETAPSIKEEFHRRTRIGAGGFQSLCWLAPLLSPTYGRVAFCFWSHKVLRWFCPLFMLIALVTNIGLASQPFYWWLLAAQLGFYAVAGLGRFVPGTGAATRVARLTAMFVGMNFALAVGFWRWAGGRQSGAWKRTARSLELAGRSTSVPVKRSVS